MASPKRKGGAPDASQDRGRPDPQLVQRHFIVRAIVVLAVLHGVMFALIGISRVIQDRSSIAEVRAESDRERMAARLAPAGAVITDLAALEVAKASAAPDAPARAPLAGDEVVAQACAACHTPGLLGAPKTGDAAAWKARAAAAGGIEGLTRSAIQGKGAMPPKGGRADLSEAEVHAAIDAMMP